MTRQEMQELHDNHRVSITHDDDEGCPKCNQWVVESPWTMHDSFATKDEAIDFGIRLIMRYT